MTYMDMLSNTGRTETPVVKRASITDTRSAVQYAKTIARADYVPDRDVLACMRQRHGVCG